jgi:hypothetical protein
MPQLCPFVWQFDILALMGFLHMFLHKDAANIETLCNITHIFGGKIRLLSSLTNLRRHENEKKASATRGLPTLIS